MGLWESWRKWRAGEEEAAKINSASMKRINETGLDHHRASACVSDRRYAIWLRVVMREGADPLEGLLLATFIARHHVVFLTLAGEVVRLSLLDTHSYKFFWDSKLKETSLTPIPENDEFEFIQLCSLINEQRPNLIGKLFVTWSGNDCFTLPFFDRGSDFEWAVDSARSNIFLLGHNAQFRGTMSELREIVEQIRREDAVGIERWFNGGMGLRKPIVPGCYIKFGNDLVPFEESATEWLVVETYSQPFSDGDRLIDLLAYNLEDKCFQGLLSYNFHITGCVVSEPAMHTEEL